MDKTYHKIHLDDLQLIKDELQKYYEIFYRGPHVWWKKMDKLLESMSRSINRHRVMENTRTDGYLTHEDFKTIFEAIKLIEKAVDKPFGVHIEKKMTSMSMHGEISIEYKARQKSMKEIEEEAALRFVRNYTKVKNNKPIVLKPKINFSALGKINHPLREELFQKGKHLESYSQLLRNKLIELENQYPEYEDFYYEYESDDTGSWYNLMGTGI